MWELTGGVVAELGGRKEEMKVSSTSTKERERESSGGSDLPAPAMFNSDRHPRLAGGLSRWRS